MESHLLQMRGLKRDYFRYACRLFCVASFTDAWIETTRKPGMSVEGKVASFTDAWIETGQLR